MRFFKRKGHKRQTPSIQPQKEINQVITGMIISFRVIIDQYIIENSLLVAFTLALNLTVFWYFFDPNILIFVPLISITVLFLIFLVCYIASAKKFFNFNIMQGVKIYIKSEFARTPFIITLFYIFYLLFKFKANPLSSFITSPIVIGFLLVIIIIWISYFVQAILIVVKPKDPIIYAINLLEKSIINWSTNSYLDRNEKSKIYHAIKLSYEKFNKYTVNTYGLEFLAKMKYEYLLRLSLLIAMVDSNDKGMLIKLKELLEKIKDVTWHYKPKEFNDLMEGDIKTLTDTFIIGEVEPVKRNLRYLTKKYIILMIFLINIVIAIVNYLIQSF